MSVMRRLSERFWFVPAMLCVLAVAAALGLVAVDRLTQGIDLPAWVDLLLYRVGSGGSRDLLGSIATSSLAVAGTTFSITMAVLALTSSTYGPRLVRNFMADRGNQIVLGVYVATFVYCLLVLRSIRVLGDPGQEDADVFVPHLAVNGAVLLAIANVGVLVYFIHHISDSVQVATLASGVRSQLLGTIDRLYPEDVGDPADEDDLPDLTVEGYGLTLGRPGYLQSVRQENLLKAASRHDVVLDMQVGPGDHVLADTVVAVVRPAGAVDDKLVHALRRALVVTDARTPYQDVGFAVQQLTEMAVRALSPGTNDPYTAQNAIDDLSAGLTVLATRSKPSPWRRDDDGAVRVHAPGPEVNELVGTVLDQLRWYGASAPSVMHACVELVERIGARSQDHRLRAHLLGHLDLLLDAFEAAGHHEQDVAGFQDHVRRTRQVVLAGSPSG